jgi:hypothetical protein
VKFNSNDVAAQLVAENTSTVVISGTSRNLIDFKGYANIIVK